MIRNALDYIRNIKYNTHRKQPLLPGERLFLKRIRIISYCNSERMVAYEGWNTGRRLDRDAPRVRKDIVVSKQITGYEYQVLDCMEAINAGKLECDAMPHEETIRIMSQMDSIRKQWGLEFPCE